ncbi:uncharacterized protein LOC130677272 [Microplitis mediator]|uniref:uncharacterized protein LOC130677272 n=1 Tax=Microplitis mediator TaxID=375433 RepID=UPI0025536D35|nr:uncharacterized protein LOC130677272 [Microplitis mediator]
MVLIKNIILSALFASVSCYEFKIFNLSPKIPPITHTNMAQLFELCYANTSNPIAITENLVETFHKNLSITIMAPVIVINENFIAKDIQLYYPTYPMYILSVPSGRDLLEIFKKLYISPLWSKNSKFFVILETEEPCAQLWEILITLWWYGTLSCVVVCSNTGNESSLYTVNPFVNQAPDAWVGINEKFFDWHRRQIFFYNQPFTNDYKICETLFFDKTKVLGGYPVNIAAMGKNTPVMFDDIFGSLNMTQNVRYFEPINRVGKTIVADGNCDIATVFYELGDLYRDEHIVPVPFELSFIIVTQKANFQSASSEIANVIDINGAIAIILLLLVITLMIVLHNKYQIGLAVLDVLKLLMSMGIDAPLDRLAMKITFFTGFFFVFLFSPLLEGQLFAVLTRPPTYNMESLKDLYDHKYHVYFENVILDDILEEQLWKTVEDMKYLHPLYAYNSADKCLKLAMENNTVACIFQDAKQINSALKQNFHISKHFTLKHNYFLHTRKKWAMTDRLNDKVSKLKEAGILDDEVKTVVQYALKKIKAKERIKKIVDYQEIDAVDLTNLYVFMAFFQFLAVIVFGIEYIVGRYRRPRQ